MLSLGDIKFSGVEVPDRIMLGGNQRLAIHEVPGGGRIIEALGSQPGALVFEGRFLGENAFSKAKQVDGLRIIGAPVRFSGLGSTFPVIISSFEYAYENQGYVCRYRLSLERFHDKVPVNSLSIDFNTNLMSALSGAISVLTEISLIGSGQKDASGETITAAASSLSSLIQVQPLQASEIGESLQKYQAELSTSLDESGDGLEVNDFSNGQQLSAAFNNASLQSVSYDALNQMSVAQNILKIS